MDALSLGVLGCMAAATLALWFYGHYYLPRLLHWRFDESLKAFSAAIECRFPSLHGLTRRVVSLSGAVGRHMGLTPDELRDLRMAARLRDVGLCAVPFRLNHADGRSWSLAEEEAHSRHPEVSGAMLELVPSLRHLARMVRCHHTPYNGAAGPFFPSFDDIPIQSRILAVVDSYAWSDRHEGDVIARTRLEEGRGTLYDPRVVDALHCVIRSAGADRPVKQLARR